MNIASNAIAIGVAAWLTVLATGCTRHVTEREYVGVPTPMQQPAPPQQPTVIDRVTVVQPPAAPHEEMPPAPAESPPTQVGPSSTWIPGYWAMDHGDWVWIKGHWDV